MNIPVDIPLVQLNGPGHKTVRIVAVSPIAAIWQAEADNPGWTFQYSLKCGDRGGPGNAARERAAYKKAMSDLWHLFGVEG